MRRPRTRRLLHLFFAMVAALLLVAVGLGAWLAHDRAVGLVHPPRVLADSTPADFDIATWEDIAFPSPDGLTLRGWLVPPESMGGPTVIFVHGLHGNRSSLLPLAVPLVARGYGALLYDARNHGESEGTITTLGYAEAADVMGAVAFLRDRPDVGDAPLALVGHSMGAAAVLRAAARLSEVDAVVAISAFTSLEDNVAEGVRILTGLPPFPFAPLIIAFGEQEVGLQLSDLRPIDDLAAIAPRPVLFIHGQADPLVPAPNSEQLFAAASEPKVLYIVPGGQHGDIVEQPPEEMLAQVIAFMDEHLPIEPPPR